MDQRQDLSLKIRKALPLLAVAVLFFSGPTFAKNGGTLIICKRDKLVRTLRVQFLDGGRCMAVYTKLGVDQNIGVSHNQKDCEEYVSEVLKILVRVKWDCREVKEAHSSYISS